MDLITITPGLIHIAEEIFSNLDRNSLLECQKVNEYWGSILRNPWFWFRRMEHYAKLSEEHQNEWKEFCEKLCKLKLTEDLTPYLNLIYGQLEDSMTLNSTYWDVIIKAIEFSGCKVLLEIIRIMASLIENPNATFPNHFRTTPICEAAKNGHTEIVKILAPLTENPNIPGKYDTTTPIREAAKNGHTEIIKILAPLTANPNAPDIYGKIPIYLAAYYGHTEVVKILAPLTDNPNAPDKDGYTPIYWAAYKGHTDIVKILAPLTNNPNAPDNDGITPIYRAAYSGHAEIVKILAPLTDNPNAPDDDGKTPGSVTKSTEIQSFLESFNKSRKRKAESSHGSDYMQQIFSEMISARAYGKQQLTRNKMAQNVNNHKPWIIHGHDNLH